MNVWPHLLYSFNKSLLKYYRRALNQYIPSLPRPRLIHIPSLSLADLVHCDYSNELSNDLPLRLPHGRLGVPVSLHSPVYLPPFEHERVLLSVLIFEGLFLYLNLIQL